MKQPLFKILTLTVVLLGSLLPISSQASTDLPGCLPLSEVDADTIAVAIRNAPPFVQAHPLNGLEGIAVDLWEAIAQRLDRPFEYVCMELFETTESLKHGSIDIAISPLTISSAREEVFDFSHQYFTSRLVFAGPPDRISFDVSKITNAFSDLIQSDLVLYGLGIAIGVALIFTVIGTVFNNYYNPAAGKIGNSNASVAGHMFVISFLNVVGIRHKEFLRFQTVSLQVLFLITLVIGILFSATVGGIVTTIFLTSANRTTLVAENNLQQHKFSTLAGSTAEGYLLEQFPDVRNAPNRLKAMEDTWLRRESWNDTLKDLSNREAELVLGDWAQLIYLANQPGFRGQIHVGSKPIRFEPYGWGLPPESQLREEVNRELIEILRSDAWPVTVRRYMGVDIFNQ